MGDSLITVIAIFLAAILMFVFPLASISEMNDAEALAMVQAHTTEFVDIIRKKGAITKEDYDEYIQDLYATGNSYKVEFEVQIADSNYGKKTENQQMGDTAFYSAYTSQIEAALNSYENGYAYSLKEGDRVHVTTRNTNTTISQMIKDVLFGMTGNDSYDISAQASGTVVSTGY